ncbi:hypothetical protein KR038_000923 [Drosophila bunnanda]|nr:hypothetical protein KR038_000923 [Drosophila bunnanda]
MPVQYVNSGFSRPIMSLLRCFLTGLYLWVMMHAACAVFVVNECWSKGFLWNSRLPDKWVYYDSLSVEPVGELWILTMIAAVLRSIYLSCGCRVVGSGRLGLGSKPRLDKIGMCAPYIGAFVGCWIFSTLLLARHMFMRELSHTSMKLYCQLILALLFKILVMANMTWFCLRAYVRLKELVEEWNRGYTSNLNFGERLSVLFHN